MRVSTTILLIIASLALLAAILLTERFVPSTEDAKQAKLYPLTLLGDEIDGIELDVEGVKTVLELRSRYTGKPLNDPTKYFDLRYYDKAKGN